MTTKTNTDDEHKDGTQERPVHVVGGCGRRGGRRPAFDQEVSGVLHTPVVGRGFDVEEAAHQGVDVHGADGRRVNSLAEVGSPREEDGFHGGELVAVAVSSFAAPLQGLGYIL